MRTLASLGMGEGQLCSCAVVVRCWRWGCVGANESNCFVWRRDVKKNGRGKERGYWLLQEGLLLEKIERMNK